MKKIFITLFLVSSLLFQIDNSFAEESSTTKESSTKESSTVLVRTTEKVPGVECNPVEGTYDGTKESPKYKLDKNGNEQAILYDCKVEKGVTQIVKMLGSIIKYFTYIASLVGVLFIVYNGILYSMGGADPSLKDDAKKRIIGTLIGLILLLLSGPILQLIAPWIYK